MRLLSIDDEPAARTLANSNRDARDKHNDRPMGQPDPGAGLSTSAG
jgi:hypothetical protein